MQMTRGDYFSVLNQQSKQEIVKKCVRFFLCDNNIRELKNELASFSKLIFNGVFIAEHISLSPKQAIFKPSEINITYPKKGKQPLPYFRLEKDPFYWACVHSSLP